MHEFSIIQNIVDIAVNAADFNKLGKVKKLDLEIGKASGVEIDALRFAWESAIKGTVLADALLEINLISLRLKCRQCGFIYEPEEYPGICPQCGAVIAEIIAGKELRIKSIEG